MKRGRYRAFEARQRQILPDVENVDETLSAPILGDERYSRLDALGRRRDRFRPRR